MSEEKKKSSFRTVYRGGEGRYEEKKSVFLGRVIPVLSEEEALAEVEAAKKKYWDARHNCFAYVLGENSSRVRASDDGEPSGTAGRPILDVLTGEGITNALIIVTRYFGGVLLGTGGLVRAYTAAARDAVENSILTQKIWGAHLRIVTDYTDIGRLQYMLAQRQIPTLSADYGEKVTMEIVLPAEEQGRLEAEIMEATAARTSVEKICLTYYGEADGKIILG